jgi:hypothetical protein
MFTYFKIIREKDSLIKVLKVQFVFRQNKYVYFNTFQTYFFIFGIPVSKTFVKLQLSGVLH